MIMFKFRQYFLQYLNNCFYGHSVPVGVGVDGDPYDKSLSSFLHSEQNIIWTIHLFQWGLESGRETPYIIFRRHEAIEVPWHIVAKRRKYAPYSVNQRHTLNNDGSMVLFCPSQLSCQYFHVKTITTGMNMESYGEIIVWIWTSYVLDINSIPSSFYYWTDEYVWFCTNCIHEQTQVILLNTTVISLHRSYLSEVFHRNEWQSRRRLFHTPPSQITTSPVNIVLVKNRS